MTVARGSASSASAASKRGRKSRRRAGEQSGVAGNEQAVHVVQRQGVQQRVRLAEAPGVDQRQRVRGEIAVGQHGALGAPGGARGVEQRREVVVTDRHDRRLQRFLVESIDQIALTVGVQRRDLGRSDAERRDLGAPGRVAHDQGRLGIAEEIVELRERVGGVQRQVDRATAQAGEVEQQVRDALLDLDRDPVAGADPQARQARRQAGAALVQAAVGEAAAVRDLDRDALRCGLHPAMDQLVEIGHGARSGPRATLAVSSAPRQARAGKWRARRTRLFHGGQFPWG